MFNLKGRLCAVPDVEAFTDVVPYGTLSPHEILQMVMISIIAFPVRAPNVCDRFHDKRVCFVYRAQLANYGLEFVSWVAMQGVYERQQSSLLNFLPL